MNAGPNPPRDLLLTSGKVMCIILQIMISIAAIAIVIALPALLLNTHWVADALAESESAASLSTMMVAISVILVLAFGVVMISLHFFRLLRKIIDTVGEGQPFSAINAERLNLMGWIALIFQLASIPIGAIGFYLATHLPNEDITADFEFSLTGVLFAIILFILARIFREGAAMRDDLEGTV